ncbi:B-box type zinc finger protein ncl-1-like [Amphibalanus amphitrite]|uniref:B-box type zinc finger protein ncl-1-like n=1 Tax=Amphibalanus amphitrite TaxID=1232801 RepID=UPI001C92B10D|nr:B-box type zinc finger protein ncl-1-like [Amphibalanus amphitrite]XP_043207896.1 B-box type zinc finger protein ncl-1-like [Amphibalanus amphitrite]
MSGSDSFLDLDATLVGEDQRLEPLEEESADTVCSICGEGYQRPRLLRCLHAFCERCVQRQHEEDEDESGAVECRRCQQPTRLDERGAAALPLDHVTLNLRDMQLVREGAAACSSCRAGQPAEARCADCAHFLCAQCHQAHQKMNCFQRHQAMTLTELEEAANKNPIPIHRPVLCDHHPDTQVSLACISCKEPACEQCQAVGGAHPPPEHLLKRICDVERTEWGDFLTAIDDAKAKRKQMDSTGNGVQSALEQLQAAHERCCRQIEQQFEAVQRAVTEHHQRLRQRCDQLHRQKRDLVWDVGERCHTDKARLEQALRLADRLVEFANSAELLSLKPVLVERMRESTQVTQLPRDLDLTFVCQSDSVDATVKAMMGHFLEDAPPPPPPPPAPVAAVPQPPVGAAAAVSRQQPALTRSPPEGRVQSGPLPPAARPYSRQNTTISPVEADMPPFSAGYNSLSSPSLPSPINGLGSSSGIGSSLSSLSGGHNGGPLALGPSPPPHPGQTPMLSALADGGFRLPQPPPSSADRAATAAAAAAAAAQLYERSQSFHEPSYGSDMSPSLPLDFLNSGSQMALQNIKALARLGSTGGSGGGDLIDGFLSGRGHAPPPQPPPAAISPMMAAAAGDGMMGRSGLQSLRGISPSGPASPLLGAASPLLGHNGFAMPPVGGGGGSGTVSPTPRRGAGCGSAVSSMQIRAKFGQLGQLKGQFNSPHGFCLGTDEEIIVADTNNHRIQMFDKTGEFKYMFGSPGKDEGQLWYPRKVAVIRSSGKFVVCDRGSERSRMQIFNRNGYFVRKISIRCIDIVAGLAISNAGHIVVVDSVTPTVFVIAESGSLIKWFDCSNYMREPSDIAVSGNEYYICDFKNHCVVVFDSEGQFLRRLGSETITNFPNGIDVSDAGDVLIGDSHGNKFHVAVFSRNGQLLSEFECPHVKVSRCCGLKLTHEGYIITIAKNNHHVLVLNTLYIA